MRTEQQTRVVHGTVLSTGVIYRAGTPDFTATKTATGSYTVRFTRPFRSVPTVTVAATGAQLAATAVVSNDTQSLAILTYSAGGAAADAGFNFTAVGQ